MELNSKKFRQQVYGTSAFFIIFILMGIILVIGKGMANLPASSVVNITADIFGMGMGYLLFICCILDSQKAGKTLNYFLILLVTDFMAMFMDECAWLVDGMPSLWLVNLLVNTFYYISSPVLAFTFWKYVIHYLRIEEERVAVGEKIAKYGLILALSVRMVNVFTGIYFSVDQQGVYHRSSWNPLSLIYSYFVMIMAIVMVVRERKRLQRFQVIILFLYALVPLMVGIFTVFFYGISLTSPIVMMVFLLMYGVLNVFQGKEKMLVEKELNMAKDIQENVLPRIFPPFPDRKEFELYASMTPAKEVGGDFYDFFLIDEDHLAMVIADVSGKGIPAALFMMVSKTLLKSQTLADSKSVASIFSRVNDQLCEGNNMDMFVTVWMGILTISTGELKYANAGHENPAICHRGESFTLVKERHSLPLATMEGIPFKEGKTVLLKGDILYVYTDGVAEATNSRLELYGTDRMVDVLNRNTTLEPQEIDWAVRADIDLFVGEAPQFDDITMLCLKYNG